MIDNWSSSAKVAYVMKLDSYALTDVGLVRGNNEDAVAVYESLSLFLLSDGVGGQNAGEVASQMAVTNFEAHLRDVISTCPDETLLKAKREALWRTNKDILDQSEASQESYAMAATFTSAWFVNGRAYLLSLGDSRIYLVRQEQLWLLTEDQTVAMSKVREYKYRQDVRDLDYLEVEIGGNILSQALGGVSKEIEPYKASCVAQEGDVFCLCSDGLYGMVSSANIEKILLKYRHDLKKCAEKLIKAANKAGGRDNISVILVKVVKSEAS